MECELMMEANLHFILHLNWLIYFPFAWLASGKVTMTDIVWRLALLV